MQLLKKIKSQITLTNGMLLLALVITLLWAWGTVQAIQNNFVLQQQVDRLAAQNTFYDLQNQTLKYQQKYYQTDEYLELSARERLNKAGAGEKLLILPPNTVKSKDTASGTAKTTPADQRNGFEKFVDFLFGR